MKSLVVYYSRTGNTRFVAEKIAEKLEADVEELVDRKDRSGPIGYLIAGRDATLERETDIGRTEHSLSDYDLVVLGVPVWNSRVPPAMRTYLNRVDLSKKKIALFCTDEGSGSNSVFSSMRQLTGIKNPLGQLVVTNVLRNREETERRVEEWCRELTAKKKHVRKSSR